MAQKVDLFTAAVNERIAELKVERNDSIRSLGCAIGISHASVGRKLRGETAWSLEEVSQLAKHWGYPGVYEFIMTSREIYEKSWR